MKYVTRKKMIADTFGMLSMALACNAGFAFAREMYAVSLCLAVSAGAMMFFKWCNE